MTDYDKYIAAGRNCSRLYIKKVHRAERDQ